MQFNGTSVLDRASTEQPEQCPRCCGTGVIYVGEYEPIRVPCPRCCDRPSARVTVLPFTMRGPGMAAVALYDSAVPTGRPVSHRDRAQIEAALADQVARYGLGYLARLGHELVSADSARYRVLCKGAPASSAHGSHDRWPDKARLEWARGWEYGTNNPNVLPEYFIEAVFEVPSEFFDDVAALWAWTELGTHKARHQCEADRMDDAAVLAAVAQVRRYADPDELRAAALAGLALSGQRPAVGDPGLSAWQGRCRAWNTLLRRLARCHPALDAPSDEQVYVVARPETVLGSFTIPGWDAER